MMDLRFKTIGEIAVIAPAATRVFEEFKIDYCCAGNKMFPDACEAAGVETETVCERIEELVKAPTVEDAPEKMATPELIKYIVERHHAFTREEIARLSALAEKVTTVHGANHPELTWVRESFTILANDLIPHMRNEEMVLFPYIEKLAAAAAGTEPLPPAPFGTINNPVRMMCLEHDEAGNILRKMRRLTGDYTLPEDACGSFRAYYSGLEELEADLHRHIHLENNVLFPQALRMEMTLSLQG
jgi:regulator of cell morphogenesis and NO signaling